MNEKKSVLSGDKPVTIRKRGARTNSPGLKQFEELVSQNVRIALARENACLQKLSMRLSQVGIDMDNKNLSKKIKKGNFSASLYLAIEYVLSEKFIKK